MKRSNNSGISGEVFKDPYCGKNLESIQSDKFLSERICLYTIGTKKNR